MIKPNHIVLTTIREPLLLLDYFENFKKYDVVSSVKIWIVGDKKTPIGVYNLSNILTKKGLETIFLDIEKQELWGKRFPSFYKKIPYNNETRRNIGYLHAMEDGCQRMISIDDDNWPSNDDFIDGHLITGSTWSSEIISSNSGFYNYCEKLKFKPERIIYPRGYPLILRNFKNTIKYKSVRKAKKIGVNMGLWLGDPDIDAITWLNGKVESIAYDKKLKYNVLDENTWIPINTQNTSIVRDLIPAFFCIPMGWNLPGGKIQRFGDIWGGYFLQSVLKNTNYNISFGEPIVIHKRNYHNYTDDLRCEYWGINATDWLVDLLKNEFKPKNLNICDRMSELAFFIKEFSIKSLPEWNIDGFKEFLIDMSENIFLWSQVCKKIF